jgi:hypothetical protein
LVQRFANDEAIKRKAKMGTIFTFSGFGLLILSLVFSFRSETISTFSLGSALAGALISQVGVILSNKWGRRPRVDEIIDSALKGLDSRFALFHYALGSNHVLFTPSTTYALVPCDQKGEISYRDGKWWQLVEGKRRKREKALKNLDKDAQYDARSTMKKIGRLTNGENVPEVTPLLVFLHPEAKLKSKNSQPEAVHYKKLKSHLRQVSSRGELSPIVDELAERLRFL